MSNKTISINPNLFNVGGTKTKKNRKKTIVPLISPNVLKNKLLKRIKEHKQRETDNLDNNKKNLSQQEIEVKTEIGGKGLDSFSDEFSDSINYLQTLSKQKKINDEKNNYEFKKQKLKESSRQTLKNYSSTSAQPYVNIDLPEELQINVNTEQFKFEEKPIIIKPYTHDTVPYGVLKGGQKPTYRDWSRTQKNNIVTNPNNALTIQGRETNEREMRLKNLREKLHNKQLEESLQKNEDIMMTQNLIKTPVLESIVEKPLQQIQTSPLQQIQTSPLQQIQTSPLQQIQTSPLQQEKVIAIKNIIKKTIKRKYTLGKSNIKKTVGVLVKDRDTRKLILSAQKELKKQNINDVKLYLRNHNLIKSGSNAPNDVIRKLYESAMLAGEITNSNTETLLHNFSKDDKEL
jgi:hypothetical protein